MPGASDMDSAVRVVVTPSQSSYFAGEPFSVTITFTNTRTAESPVKAHSSHKRGAHSISSAPIARPPTSPGPPRTPTSSSTFINRHRNGEDIHSRKRLVGQDIVGPDQLPELIEQRRKRLLAKSLSVSVGPQELEESLGSGILAQRNPADGQYGSPSSPKFSSPLSRSHTLALSSSHPHARKQSVLDGQAQVAEPVKSVPPSPSPYTPNSSTSSFALALDPISEAAVTDPYPLTPSMSSPSISTPHPTPFPPSNHDPGPQGSYGYPPPRHARRHSQQIGLGLPPLPKANVSNPPRTAFSSTFLQSNAELILYSYAQLNGIFTLSPTPTTPEQSHSLNVLRSTLLNKKAVVGGGSMDISSSLSQPPTPVRRSHSRSSSFSGLISLLSPTLTSPVLSPPGRQRAPSMSSFSAFDDTDPDAPLPTLEVQPAMLAVDLSLLPGESRTYTYSVSLPDSLPPTFRGRSLKFSYELIVGTCKANSAPGTGSAAPAGGNSISRVMKVPIRVYNHVAIGRSLGPYDLMWPVTKKLSKTSSNEVTGKVVEEPTKLSALKRSGKFATKSPSQGTFDDLKSYAHALLESFPDPNSSGVRLKLPAEGLQHSLEQEGWLKEDRRQETGGLSGCREAVEILTRNPKKASYDVNKDGVKVAVLTFPKSAYRLGETIVGVVELNRRTSRSRVMQLSAMLETQEYFPSSISGPSNSRHLRRVHAEHHSSFALSTLRTTFSLDIPSDASPAFQIKVGTDRGSKPGGLDWKVRLCLLVAVVPETSFAGSEGVRLKGLVRDGPRGEWGSSWRASSTISPMNKPVEEPPSSPPPTSKSWGSFFASSILGSSEPRYHDGDEEYEDQDEQGVYDGIKADEEGGVGVGVNFGGGEIGWKGAKVETVECEVPIKVWPGNTAFKPVEVVFDV
ncbi:Rgp1-domain-containing protein [Mycena floridula]|nr:Rgp1-domain-containing protein [Mycena floridula]